MTKNKTTITYDTYLKGVNGELSYDELDAICQKHAPEGHYYNYDKIRAVLLRKLNGEIDDKYFKTWLIVVSWALNEDKYYPISDAFDGHSFDDLYDRSCILGIMALLKDENYRLMHKDYMAQHQKEKLKVIYLRFEHCNWTADSSVYKAYFVDYKNKCFDIRFVDDAFFDFDDNVMYCFIGYEDENSDEEECEICPEEPKELPEERRLMSLFYNEKAPWKYDHTLSF